MNTILNVIQESRAGSFYQIETVLQNLIKEEDEAINQLINGEISVDTYCNLLIDNGNRRDAEMVF